MSKLLLISKARDDYELRQRLATALSLQGAAATLEKEPSANSLKLADYVVQNAPQLVDRLFNMVAMNPSVADKIKMSGEAIDTSDITDEEIQAIIAARWAWFADYFAARGLV